MGQVLQFPVRPGHEPELPIIVTAREIGRTPRTLQRWVNLGCPHKRENGHLRFKVSDVLRWMEERTQEDGAA